MDVNPDQLWGNPEFEAFKRGFNIPVHFGQKSGPRLISVSVSIHLLLAPPQLVFFLQFIKPEKILSLVAGLYNPRLVDPQVIISRLVFQIHGRNRRRARADTRHDFAQLFARAIIRYVNGTGHPRHPVVDAIGTITEEDHDRELGNTHTRPYLMLTCFTESKVYMREDVAATFKVCNNVLS